MHYFPLSLESVEPVGNKFCCCSLTFKCTAIYVEFSNQLSFLIYIFSDGYYLIELDKGPRKWNNEDYL